MVSYKYEFAYGGIYDYNNFNADTGNHVAYYYELFISICIINIDDDL